jgi:2'-hydroxyisoflavone reductase
MKRRDAFKVLGAAALSAAIGANAEARPKPLKILILGGTGFIGPHFVQALTGKQHKVTLFNRGKRDPEVKPGIEQLLGDRNGDIAALKDRDWDIVIDNSGYTPRQVRATAELLKGHVERYIFISSIAVCADFKTRGLDENSPLAVLADPTTNDVTGETYGGLKVLCEQVVEENYARNATLIRPSYICGPGDHTDRFTYWPFRVSQGGDMLAPGKPGDPFQYIDVDDLSNFVVRCAEKNIGGAFNLCTEPGSVTMGSLLETSKKVTGADTSFVWASREFLEANEIFGEKAKGNYLPIWQPGEGDDAGILLAKNAKAVKAGLKCRSLESTIKATLEWQKTRPEDKQKLKAGLSREMETELLGKLHS